MRTREPALSSSSSAIEGLKSSCTRWTLLGPAGGPLGRPAAPAAPAIPAITGEPIAGEEGTSSVHAGLAGTTLESEDTEGGAGKYFYDIGKIDIAVENAIG